MHSELEISPQSLNEVLYLGSMNPTLKRHLISGGVTFFATFFTVFGANLMLTDTAQFSGSVLVALVISAVRAAVKAVFEGLRV